MCVYMVCITTCSKCANGNRAPERKDTGKTIVKLYRRQDGNTDAHAQCCTKGHEGSGLAPIITTTRRLKFGNMLKRGQAMGWFIKRKPRGVNAEGKKGWRRRHRWPSSIRGNLESQVVEEYDVLYPPPTAHLHRPSLHQSQDRPNEWTLALKPNSSVGKAVRFSHMY